MQNFATDWIYSVIFIVIFKREHTILIRIFHSIAYLKRWCVFGSLSEIVQSFWHRIFSRHVVTGSLINNTSGKRRVALFLSTFLINLNKIVWQYANLCVWSVCLFGDDIMFFCYHSFVSSFFTFWTLNVLIYYPQVYNYHY